MEKAAALVGVNVSFSYIEEIAYCEINTASSTLIFYLGRSFETFIREKNFEETELFKSALQPSGRVKEQ